METNIKYYWIGTNTPSSKNNRVWTGTYFIPSERTVNWRKNSQLQWEIQRDEFLEEIKDLSRPLYLEFTFIRKSRHKFDYINIAQTIQDEMKFHGWIAEDDATEIKPFFADFIYDPLLSGCLIRVLKQKPIL